jgi:hypothetical protein
VGLGQVGRAVGLFTVTNIDDLVLLAPFFGQAAGRGGGVPRVVLGQYLGFIGIMAVAVAGALGAGLLPESVLPYLGLLPLALGLRAAWRLWRERYDQDHDGQGWRPFRPRRASNFGCQRRIAAMRVARAFVGQVHRAVIGMSDSPERIADATGAPTP